MKRFLWLLLLLPLVALGANTPMSAVTVNPSPPPLDTHTTIDETGTNTYALSYLNVAKYIHGKISGDCTVNTTSFAITCTKINGLTFPALVNAECLTNNGTTLSWGVCGSGGGGTFDGVGTGTNTQYTLTCGSSGGNSCYIHATGTGAVDANWAGGVAIPASAGTEASQGVLITNASSQFTTQNFLTLPPITYAAAVAAVTCGGGTEGTVFWIKDANAAPGSNVTAGSSTHHVLMICDGTNWVAH